jgi:hypothetical protein
MKQYQGQPSDNNFFDNIKQELLPTPKKQHIEGKRDLLFYLTNKDHYYSLEKYLKSRKYDNRLHFYSKVMEF